MNDGYPSKSPTSRAGLLARLTGAATLAAGALLYGNGSSQVQTLPAGTAGQVLVSAGAAAPVWTNIYAQANTWSAVQTFSALVTANGGVRTIGSALTAYNGATSSLCSLTSNGATSAGTWNSYFATNPFIEISVNDQYSGRSILAYNWSTDRATLARPVDIGAPSGGSETLRVGGSARITGTINNNVSQNNWTNWSNNPFLGQNPNGFSLSSYNGSANSALLTRFLSSGGHGSLFGYAGDGLEGMGVTVYNGDGANGFSIHWCGYTELPSNINRNHHFGGGARLCIQGGDCEIGSPTGSIERFRCNGTGRFTGKITTVSAVPASFSTLADVRSWLATNFA